MSFGTVNGLILKFVYGCIINERYWNILFISTVLDLTYNISVLLSVPLKYVLKNKRMNRIDKTFQIHIVRIKLK